MSLLRDWLQLVRLPNLFTAMADPLAGALIVGAGWRQGLSIAAVMLASACLYAGGVALNDWNDFKKDLHERPSRPLPSEKIRRIYALFLSIGLLLLGASVSMIAGQSASNIAIVLALVIVTYDILVKSLPIAPAVMGLCRSLNLLMGMMVVSDAALGRPVLVVMVVAMGVYILGATLFARREARPDHRDLLVLGAALTCGAVIVVALLRLFSPAEALHASGGILAGILLGVVGYRMMRAIAAPRPESVQLAVKTAIIGVIVFDAALVASARGPGLSVPVLVLLIPAVWFGKWLYST